MIRILLSLMLLGAIHANAADWITATIHVSTNAPLGNTNNLSINGDTRTFTNTVTGSPATLIQETNSVTSTATNILNHLTSYKVNPGFYLSQTSSTNVTVRGLVGGAMAITLAGGWGHVTYSTQTVQTPTYVVRVPVSNEAATNRVTIANGLVDAASDYATSSFDTNAVALSNFITKGSSPRQHISSPITLNGGLSGILEKMTNGYGTNQVFDSPKTTNLVNYGNAIRSEGSGGNSLQLGSNALATGTRSVAIGNSSAASVADSLAVGLSAAASGQFSSAIGNGAQSSAQSSAALGQNATASGINSTALGTTASASGLNSTALGNSPSASETNSIAIGVGATASGFNSVAIGDDNTQATAIGTIAIGSGADASFQDSIAIGGRDSSTAEAVSTTATNQIRLGTTKHTVSIPGVLQAASTTNSVMRGTNKWDGDLELTRRANSSPVNGDNSGVVLGTNVVISITGPTTIGAYAGFSAERGDSFHFVRFSGAITNIIRNQSGLEATAANRIITGTGADLSLTNEPSWIQLIRNGSSDRWEVIAHSR